MLRSTLAILVLAVTATSVPAEEPPKELKALIEQAEDCLNKGKYADYFRLTMHPVVRQAHAQNGSSMEKLGLIMERKPQSVALMKKGYAAIKNAPCRFNADRTEATFALPREFQGTELGSTMVFEYYEKKWYVSPK